MVLDVDPSNSFRLGVAVEGLGLANLAVVDVLLRLDRRPDGVEAPVSAALDEDAHSDAVADGEQLTLVADEGEHHPGQEVVVDVERTLRCKAFRVPHNEANEEHSPGQVAR